MRYRPDKHRLPPFNMDGVLLVDKAPDWTSFDVVNFLKNRFNIPKIGHCGTLDPAATGLLVIVCGKFTRLSGMLSADSKVYETRLLLGVKTDTDDMEGKIIEERPTDNLDKLTVEKAIYSFVGDSMQIPPMVSAIKKDGKKLYELARKGIEIEREPRPIHISKIDIHSVDLPEAHFTVHCSKGTYIRSLCADIGTKLGNVGTLKELRRTASGKFSIEDAITLEKLKTMEQSDLAVLMRQFLVDKLSLEMLGGKL
ncbi:MAG: tRNA pseudouridine(55) synthase TruB [Lentisphaeria bacterium]|nr:tRNA pseudouridine(55) synthase TruB [Lentisphaeria bacterium]